MISENFRISHINKIKKDSIKKTDRNYGIDLLRVFSMINIINLHINLFSGQLSSKFNSVKYKSIWRL